MLINEPNIKLCPCLVCICFSMEHRKICIEAEKKFGTSIDWLPGILLMFKLAFKTIFALSLCMRVIVCVCVNFA